MEHSPASGVLITRVGCTDATRSACSGGEDRNLGNKSMHRCRDVVGMLVFRGGIENDSRFRRLVVITTASAPLATSTDGRDHGNAMLLGEKDARENSDHDRKTKAVLSGSHSPETKSRLVLEMDQTDMLTVRVALLPRVEQGLMKRTPVGYRWRVKSSHREKTRVQ